MAKFFRVLSVLALAYFCTPTAAQAIPITIDFSGTLTQAMAGGCAYCGTYTATIFFDTADGLLAVVELELPASAQGAFIPAGSTFDAMAAVSKIFASATKDLLVVDPYFDEKILIEFAQFAQESVAVRLLGDEAGVKGTLNPAVKSWKNQFGNKRPLSVRLAPPRSLHDRLILIDGLQVWTVGQSFNALAARAPTSFNKSDDDTAALKLRAFGDIWGAAKPI